MSGINHLPHVVANKITDEDINYFAKLANVHSISVGLTLIVNGSIITGVTISGEDYYKDLLGSLRPYQEGSAISLIAENFKSAQEAFAPKNFDSNQTYDFLHLKNISIKQGDGHFFEMNDGLLRIKIEEIDGYIYGITPSN